MSPLIKLKKDDAASTGIGGLKDQPDSVAAPFWVVMKGDTPNMVIKHVTAAGVRAPVLVNSKKLKSGDQLRMSEDTVAALAGPARAGPASGEPKRKALRTS